MADSGVDVTVAPAKILWVHEIKNGKVFIVTENKVYELMDGKFRPIVFADVEAAAVTAKSKVTPVGAVPAAPAPPQPVTPTPTPAASSGFSITNPPLTQ